MARRAEIVLLILDARQGAPAFTGRVAAPPSRRDDEARAVPYRWRECASGLVSLKKLQVFNNTFFKGA